MPKENKGLLTYQWLVGVMLLVITGLSSFSVQLVWADRNEVKTEVRETAAEAKATKTKLDVLQSQYYQIYTELGEIKTDVKTLIRNRQ